VLLGWWGASLPAKLESESVEIIEKYKFLETETIVEENPSKKRNHKLWGLLFVLLFVCITFVLQGSGGKAFYAIARTIAALLILFFLVSPLIKWLMQKWFAKAKNEKQQAISQLMDTIPELRSYVKPAMQLAKESDNGLLIYKSFVMNLIVISLYHQQD
jgi:membrane protease YdiL (CAAX protease family)